MTATSPYLNHPVRTEREAQLEAEVHRLRGAAAEVVRQCHAKPINPQAWVSAVDNLAAALSPTRNGGA